MLHENTLTKDEVLGLRVLCSLAFEYDSWRLHTCETCHKPETWWRGKIEGPQEKRRLVRLIMCRRGCIGKAEKPYKLYDGTDYSTCPRKFENSYLSEYLRSYLWYEDKGTMPDAGGLYDQPHKWVLAIEVIRGAFRRLEQLRADREKEKAKRRNLSAPPTKARR